MLSVAKHLYHKQHRPFGREEHAPSYRPEVLREDDTLYFYHKVALDYLHGFDLPIHQAQFFEPGEHKIADHDVSKADQHLAHKKRLQR